jgi:phospholipid/cholesterol/gamma-HCH transport system substrate-binding protein
MSGAPRLTTTAKVGAFALATLVAAFLVYRFVTKSGGSGNGYRVYAMMADATGIAQRSQVRIAGIPVGNIESVKLDHGRARIDIRINPDVPLYEDAAVAKVSSSLLGEYFLSLSPGTEGRRKLKDGDRIGVVVEAATTDQIMKDIASISKDVKKVTEALANTVGTDQGRENIKDTLANLAQVTDALNKTVRENRDTIHSILINMERITTEGRPEVREILGNVRETTAELRELMQKTDGPPGTQPPAGEIRQIVEKVNRASTSLESALKNIDEVTGRLERGEGTLGRLTKDEQLIDEVQGAVEGVSDFVGGVSRLQTILVLRTDYQFLSGSVKSYVELRLQPREDKYYLVEVINEPRGATRIEQTVVDTDNPNEPGHYREIRTVTTNSLRFSLQFAQRFGPFTGRFGIKESTGGIGLDTLLFQDRFELRQDLYGFGEVVLPRWRVSLGYEFVHRLWLIGGVDDILSDSRRDYFVGAQLKFNDEDLKTILPFAPTP